MNSLIICKGYKSQVSGYTRTIHFLKNKAKNKELTSTVFNECGSGL